MFVVLWPPMPLAVLAGACEDSNSDRTIIALLSPSLSLVLLLSSPSSGPTAVAAADLTLSCSALSLVRNASASPVTNYYYTVVVVVSRSQLDKNVCLFAFVLAC